MVCLTVLYPAAPGSRFDWDYYLGVHMALAHRLLDPQGLVRIEIERGIDGFPPGSAAPFHAVARLFFQSARELESALGATAPELIADVPNYTDNATQVQVSEIVV